MTPVSLPSLVSGLDPSLPSVTVGWGSGGGGLLHPSAFDGTIMVLQCLGALGSHDLAVLLPQATPPCMLTILCHICSVNLGFISEWCNRRGRMYRYENMHPMWLPLVYRTQWQLGVINHFVLITSHSCSVSNSSVDLFFFPRGSFRTINHAKDQHRPNKSRLRCFSFGKQLVIICNHQHSRFLLDTLRLENYSKSEINFTCLHF